jgi:hypothetical protein
MDRDEISNLYRGPPIDDTFQVSVHLVKLRGEDILEINLNRNLVGSIFVRSSVKIAHFPPDPLTNMPTTDNSCF